MEASEGIGGRYDAAARRFNLLPGLLPAALYQRALQLRSLLRGHMLHACERYDVLVSPYQPMVLVSYKLYNIYRTINTKNVSFWACNPPATLHAGKRDIPAMRGEPYDDRGVYHRVVLRDR